MIIMIFFLIHVGWIFLKHDGNFLGATFCDLLDQGSALSVEIRVHMKVKKKAETLVQMQVNICKYTDTGDKLRYRVTDTKIRKGRRGGGCCEVRM